MTDRKGIAEMLRARHIVRASIAHIVVAWGFVQVADVLMPYLGVVDEPVRWALIIAVATFPITLAVAWLTDAGRPLGELLAIVFAAIVAVSWVSNNLPEGVGEKSRLAILPFEHGGDALGESLSRALVQEIGSLLMRSRSLDVIGEESASAQQLQGVGTVAIADRLAVNALLSGSVAANGDRMRIELTLKDASGESLWEESIDEAIASMFSVQERIATEIESRLGAGDNAVPIAKVAAERCWMPTDAKALQDYYTARYYISVRSESEQSRLQLDDAIKLYENLIEQYPEFSDARSGLAFAIFRKQQWFPGGTADRAGNQARMLELAQRAYDDCPGNGEAMHILPNQYDHENGWLGEYRQLTAFIELEPHKLEHLERLAGHYRMTGLAERALATSQRHVALNPLAPRALQNRAALEQQYGDLDKAIVLWDALRELGWQGPNFARQVKVVRDCNWDVDCVIGQDIEWPALTENADLLRIMTRSPTNDEEREESIEAGMALYARDPANNLNTVNAIACRIEHLTPLFFDAWQAFKRDGESTRSFWFWPNGWVDACSDVWSDPRFADYVSDNGFPEYWREVDWPKACRPAGDTFACGTPAD